MFRILSLDRGGIKGAFTASVLATLEEDTGCAAADHFDLITGTSTGGIIAIGLGLGLPARKICDFYAEKGATIFPGTSLVQRASRCCASWGFRPRSTTRGSRCAWAASWACAAS